MSVCGMIRFAVSENGENTWVLDYQANDLNMQDYISEFIDDSIDDLFDLNEVKKMLEKKGESGDISNVLLAVAFSHESVKSFNGESTEYDDDFIVEDVMVLNRHYKEQWRMNLTYEFGTDNLGQVKEQFSVGVDGEDSSPYPEAILEWEEFYDEDFTPFKPGKIKLSEFNWSM